jgi:opacity protein-like surface antigen
LTSHLSLKGEYIYTSFYNHGHTYQPYEDENYASKNTASLSTVRVGFNYKF